MIRFHSIKFKNIFSYGNYWTEFDLLRPRYILLTGDNGHGKSVIIDAITFAVFGHAFRDIKKGQIINSVNGKECVVNLKFDIDNVPYEITRGLKPNVFDVYRNGELISNDPDNRANQRDLEAHLNMSFETFKQIVILGSASYKPFMKLSASQRREVFEDILHLGVYGVMNDNLKKKISISKEKKKELDSKRSSLAEMVRICESRVAEIHKINDAFSTRNTENLDRLKAGLEEATKRFSELKGKRAELVKNNPKEQYKIVDKLLIDSSITRRSLTNESVSLEKSISKIKHEKDCPNCGQPMPPEQQQKNLEKLNERLFIVYDEITTINRIIDENTPTISKLDFTLKEIEVLERSIQEEYNTAVKLKEEITKLSEEKTLLDATDAENELDEKRKEFSVVNKDLDRITTILEYFGELSKILGDTGVKSKIVKKYIPLVNAIVEKQLEIMGFNASFTLDENFSETVKSRYRDEFSYESFSEGQKLRIDLALLLAWREVASKKNSVSTNLLLFDEVLDRSMDYHGTIAVVNILKSLVTENDLCCIVISHNERFQDHFDERIKVTLKGNFSYQTDVAEE